MPAVDDEASVLGLAESGVVVVVDAQAATPSATTATIPARREGRRRLWMRGRESVMLSGCNHSLW